MLSAIIQSAAGTGRALFSVGLLVAAPELLAAPALAASNIDTAQPFYLGSGVGTSVNPVFQGGTLKMDVPNGVYPQNFTLDGSATSTIDQNGNVSTFGGVFSNANAAVPGNVTIANNGSGGLVTFTGLSTYTGATTIDSGAMLALSGTSLIFGSNGNIATSSGVVDNGTFDISNIKTITLVPELGDNLIGLTVPTLSGTGTLVLGFSYLKLTNAAGTFSGTITGSAYPFIIARGSETLSGASPFSGSVYVDPGATLNMAGGGTLPNVQMQNQGVFDISATTSGVSVTALSGAGQVILGARSLTVGLSNGGGGGIFGGVISGTGSLTLNSDLALGGVNTFQGVTTINPRGEIGLYANGSIAASSNVVDNGTFDISLPSTGTSISTLSGTGLIVLGSNTLTLTNASTTFSGVITGTGSLTVSGGIETLTASNTFSGGTSVIGAALAINADAALGAPAGGLALTNGTLTALTSFDSARTVALAGTSTINTNLNTVGMSGPIGGSGGLIVSGGGRLTLSGTNSYSGGTRITGATVLAVGSDTALGAPTGPLIFDDGTLSALASFTSSRPVIATTAGGTIDTNGFTLSFSGPLKLDGPLDWTGGGEVLFANSATSNAPLTIANSFSVNNGTLTTPSLTVTPTGTLRGTGTVNAPTTVFGTVAPGNSPGTLTFTAPLTLAPGSTTQLDIDGTGTGTGAGNYSRILLIGAANAITLGGTLQPLLHGITGSASNSYTPPLGQTFAVITADGGISGSYSGLIQPAGLAPGTRFDALYGVNTLTLVVTPSTYGNLALAGLSESATEAAVGRALDAVRPAAGILPDPASATLFSPLYTLPSAAIPGALDQLSPGIYADGLMAARDTWYQMADSVGTALAMRRGDAGGLSTVPGPHGSTIWANGLGQLAHVSGNDAPNYSQSVGGAIAGIDSQVTQGITLGVAAGGASVQTSTGNGSTDNGNVVQFAVYGGVQRGMLFLDAQADYLHVDQSVRRSLSTWGVAANGNMPINGGGAQLYAGARVNWDRWQIEPTLGLTALGLASPSVSETTGGSMASRVSAQSIASVQSFAGIRFGTDLALTPTKPMHLYALAGWTHEFADVTASTDASLALSGVGPFRIASPSVGRDAARLGVGLDAALSPAISLYANYVASISGTETANNLTGGLRVIW